MDTPKGHDEEPMFVSVNEEASQIGKMWAREAEDRIDAHERGELKAVSLDEVLEKWV